MSEVHPGKVPDTRSSDPELINEPVVLHVTVVVLRGTQRVRNTLHAVYDRAGEVVGRVHSEDRGVVVG